MCVASCSCNFACKFHDPLKIGVDPVLVCEWVVAGRSGRSGRHGGSGTAGRVQRCGCRCFQRVTTDALDPDVKRVKYLTVQTSGRKRHCRGDQGRKLGLTTRGGEASVSVFEVRQTRAPFLRPLPVLLPSAVLTTAYPELKSARSPPTVQSLCAASGWLGTLLAAPNKSRDFSRMLYVHRICKG